MTKLDPWLGCLSLFFAVSRFWVPSRQVTIDGAWTDAAHLFMGILIAAVVYERKTVRVWWYLLLLAVPSVVELAVFLTWKVGR